MILVDTSVWIDFLKGTGTIGAAALHAIISDGTQFSVTDINVGEILRGIRSDAEYDGVLEDLMRFTILSPRGLETHLAAAQIYRQCRRQGVTVRKTADCLIAAIAIENDQWILHNDSDFDQIASVVDDLNIIKPEGLVAG